MKRRTRNIILFFNLRVSLNLLAATFTKDVAVSQALMWMKSNPVMGAVERGVAAVSTFPATGYGVYVVELAPRGYLVVNSDEALPPIVAFSAESKVDLSDLPANAFRTMLLRHSVKMARLLADPAAMRKVRRVDLTPMAVTELRGPFLDTSWNQNNPYNKLCPADPNGDEYYGYRVPAGCVPVVYAQIMNFHRWPVYGMGSHSYTDNTGAIQGSHSADFSDTYDWGSMRSSYSAYSPNPALAESAVAELIYELGVAAEADYESNGTSSSQFNMGHRLNTYFYYEQCATHQTLSELTAPLDDDLRAGFPCVVSVPGHSIVADGLMVDSGTKTYHINYGWGGTNNGWYLAGDVDGAALEHGVTALRPKLLAFPVNSSVTGVVNEAVELRWTLPKRRETEAETLTIYSLAEQSGEWSSDASVLPSNSEGWSISASGRNGSCWYSGPQYPVFMLLDEVFVPDNATELSFYIKYIIYDAVFTVSVSTDQGRSFTALMSLPGVHQSGNWMHKSVPLAAYAGQQVTLRFELSECTSYYPGGGVWIDDLAVNSGSWLNWEHFHTDSTLASRRFSSTATEIDDCADFSVFAVTTGSNNKNWICTSYGDVDSCFYKEPLGDWVDYDLTSVSTVTPTASSLLVFRTRHWLSDDVFSLKVSTDGSYFTEIWSTSGDSDWHKESVDISAYAGTPIYLRFTYNFPGGNYYPSGGVWIDSVALEDVANPHLEGQPIHYTAIAAPPAGVRTLKAALTDASMNEHALAPAFTLSVFDNDGMPAWWEELHNLDPFADDSGDDPDGDGFTNLEEYIAGTNPRDANSSFAIDIIGTTIHWPAIADRTYRVWSAERLAGPWQILQTLPGPTDNFIDSSALSRRFYKVDVAQ